MNEYLARFLDLTGGNRHPDRYGSIEPWERIKYLLHARMDMVMQYAWAIPDEAALDAIAKAGPIVEVGAGGGYWTSLLRGMGVDVVAYDLRTGKPNSQSNHTWTEVLPGSSRAAADHPDRSLFLCWPPYGSPMAWAAAKRYRAAGGRRLIYVGEDGGCTADDAFHELLDRDWRRVQTVSIPQWPGIHDFVSVWQPRLP